MHKPATEAELKQARRNQQFTNAPIGRGQCPWQQAQVAIFPVRYALDESPEVKGSSQGPHALPRDWPRQSPELKTRSYTLRQLRDGWVYVWNSVEQTFHEYQVSGEYFTRHPWTDAQLNQDVRHNPGETQPYLLYSRRSHLRIAYSPVQWTWRMCELMRSSAPGQRQWMREVDLPTYCVSGQVDHGDELTELGKRVADILITGETPPVFTSTKLPTQATEPGVPFKAAIEEALVQCLTQYRAGDACKPPIGNPELLPHMELLLLQARQAGGHNVIDQLNAMCENAQAQKRWGLLCEVWLCLAQANYTDGQLNMARYALKKGQALSRQLGLNHLESAFHARYPELMLSGGDSMIEPNAILLSRRELTVLEMIAQGLSNQQIAGELHLSLHTVKSHAQKINAKLGVSSRTQAVARATHLGLIV
ncbi:LuxR C-terminal-related transcriptional regulator [Pseudomonas sp. GD03860]|uniref:toxin VasX n=1 Tax=Pseudomonas TaxID=286 RepID=UPI0023641968|nr:MULTISPECIES: toxin VasX [Pseudomonas]MDD2058469.1 LuxR C-terminal-related transcriptional regulator [Pseudomonas putida]MDH0640430.1 LuxR C-terminal-related transcriptional regulator [Pseudomonas sp. GD03860]